MTLEAPAAGTLPLAAEAEPLRNPFLSARFRTWWAASLVAGAGVGIQTVTVPLFIKDRVSDDNRALAIAGALIAVNVVGALLTLFGGVVADRMERRQILVRTYGIAALVSVAYIYLSGTDVRAIWPVYPLAAIVGAAGAFTNPARQSMVPQLVSKTQLQNGIIFGNMAFMTLVQVVGPALGGGLAAAAGLTFAFTVEVVLLAVAALLFFRVPTDRPAPSGRHVFRDLADGLRYVRGERALAGLLSLGLIPGVFIMGPFSVSVVLMVEDIYKVSDGFVGGLWAAFGGGILIGSVLLTLWRIRRRGLFLLLCMVFGGFAFAAYGLTSSLPLGLGLLIVLGIVGPAVFINTVASLIQEITRPDMMGRVMSMYGLSFSVAAPVGVLAGGLLASAFGPQPTIVMGGLATAALGFVALAFMSPVRRLD